MAIKKPLPPTPPEIDLTDILARFSTDDQAREYLESIRWKGGRFCPHCGNGMCATCASSITPNENGFEYVCPTCGEKVAVKKKTN